MTILIGFVKANRIGDSVYKLSADFTRKSFGLLRSSLNRIGFTADRLSGSPSGGPSEPTVVGDAYTYTYDNCDSEGKHAKKKNKITLRRSFCAKEKSAASAAGYRVAK